MASLDDVVTVQKNGVVAVNALVQALADFKAIYESFVGNAAISGVNSNSLVISAAGRLVTVSVITGASGGTIHDAASVAAATTDNAIYAIPATAGAYAVNFPFTNGLVIKPAVTSVVSVSYSTE